VTQIKKLLDLDLDKLRGNVVVVTQTLIVMGMELPAVLMPAQATLLKQQRLLVDVE
jgi:hypothetical protein